MNRRSAILILGAILLAWTGTTFLPAMRFSFVNFDDYNEVVQNPLLNQPTNAHLAKIWSGPQEGIYAPLTYTLWWAMARFLHSGITAAAFHLLNIALHLLCAGLVFSILMTCVKSPPAAFGGAMIFALHPIQVESVAWVSEMGNLLAAALALGAIRAYLTFAVTQEQKRWWFYAAACALFLLALFAKPTAVVTPLVAFILAVGILRTSWKKGIASLLPWLVVAGMFSWIAHASQPAGGVALTSRPVIAIDAMAFYYGKLFWPVGLTVDYGRTPARVLNGDLWVGNLVIVLVLCLILWVAGRDYRGVSLGALIMLAGLLPVLGIVPFGFQEYSTVADHFIYAAMLGPALAAAVLLAAWPKWVAPITSVALAVVLSFLTSKQLPVWTDSGTLVARAWSIDRGSAIANGIAGAELTREDKPAEAIPLLQAAIVRDPNRAEYHFNLANALFRLDELDKSIAEYQIAIPLFNPPSPGAMNNLGVAYARLHRDQEAMDEFRKALKIDPQNADAAANIRILTGGVPTR